MTKIKNFCIIAHIDHGKSTLADRMLELTNTIHKLPNQQTLDTMELEQERGITIKLTPVRMARNDHELNLIDTPGHVDFQYEVSRSLAAVEWVILLVDASQGIQAQTLSTLYQAMEHDLTIIPVLNKIDLPAADPERRAMEIEKLLGVDASDIIAVSAKTGLNVEHVLDAIIDRIPSPTPISLEPTAPQDIARALIFDSVYDPYKGVVSYVKITNWSITPGKPIHLIHSQSTITPTEVGHFAPSYVADPQLSVGQIGYIVTGLKSVRDAQVGDTVLWSIRKAKDTDLTPYAIPGFQVATPFIFAGIFPLETNDYNKLAESIQKLTINDSAISYEHEKSPALGQGFRCGFLGTLHIDIVSERLKREFGMETLFTLPTVTYLVQVKPNKQFKANQAQHTKALLDSGLSHRITDQPLDASQTKTYIEALNHAHTTRTPAQATCFEKLDRWMIVKAGSDMPDNGQIEQMMEPVATVEIVGPQEYAGNIMTLAQDYRGTMKNMDYLDDERVVRTYLLPLGEIIIDFYDKLKSSTKGYATMNYELKKYQTDNLVRLDIFVNSERIEALSLIVHKDNAYHLGSNIVKRLKELIPKHLFPIPLQAGIGSKMIARETISAMRKNVIAKCYGGDITRKRKLLAKQKEGKKKMKAFGKVSVPQDLFIQILKR